MEQVGSFEQVLELRIKAEDIVKKQLANEINTFSSEDFRQIIHELKVHQIELEMQNEELRRVQQEKDKLGKLYFDLYDLAPVGYLTISEEGLIIEGNLTVANMLCIDRAKLIGQPITRFIFSEDQDIYYLKHHKPLLNSCDPQICELRILKQDGTTFWANLKATVTTQEMLVSSPKVQPQQEAACKMVCRLIIIDITELKQSEKALAQAQKMESIGVLAGGIAHDFNNILSPIIGYTELLSEDIPKESPLRSSLDEIYAASMRAKDMVKQILTFARQEKSEVRLMKMHHIVKEALKLIRSTIPATIDIKQDIRKECGLINADPTQIHQIVMNLAANAYHAMEETGGTMKVSLKEAELNLELNEEDIVGQDIQKGIYACLTVSDTGAGIPEDIRDKIFDPFFTTKKQDKGTGLGLSTVHGIVTSCCGFIRLNSEIGRGTEFNVYLPVVESYLKKDDALQVKMPMLGGNERILLVDDEAVLIALQKGMLERLGYNVTSRTSSIEALEAFRANPDKFDMVITDMAMPSMSGDKLAVELIKIRSDIPILLCTGFSTIMSEEKAISMGIKGFLMKPVTINDLDKKMRDVLKPNNLRE
ncbi:MAG: response regulator [Desulfamplus sp.]